MSENVWNHFACRNLLEFVLTSISWFFSVYPTPVHVLCYTSFSLSLFSCEWRSNKKRLAFRIQEPLVCVYDYLLQQCEKQSLSAFWRKANATYYVHVIIQKNHRRLFPTSFPKITVADDSSQKWQKPVNHVWIVSKWGSQNYIFCDRAIGGADLETSPIYKIIKLCLCLFHLGEQISTSKWQKFSHT